MKSETPGKAARVANDPPLCDRETRTLHTARTMTARELARQLNAKPCARGRWIARCPSHDDRSPSLSIAEGNDGRSLLFCHAGCSVDAVTRALGMGVQELFPDTTRLPRNSPQTRRKATTDALRDALIAEMQRYREAHGIDGLLRTEEINTVRRAVGRGFRVELSLVRRPLWEGGYGGRERDPAWPAIFEWAIDIANIRLLGAPMDFSETPLPRALLLLAEDIAANAMRSLEREARRGLSEASV